MTGAQGGTSMVEESLESLTNPEAARAAARSRAYAAFAQAFEYPDEQFCEDIRTGALREALRSILAATSPVAAESVDWNALADAGNADDLMIEYTRLFDVGASGPPCPLYGGLYGGARMKTMEEVVRFYNHFGLSTSKTPNELPDHVTTELEFMHYLAFREAEALEKGEDAGSYRRAQRDFLARHPGRWIPQLREKLEKEKPMAFFLELVRRIERFLQQDLAHLVKLEGGVPAGSASSTRTTH